MRFDSRDLALTAVFMALYAAINIIQSISPFGNPSIYGPLQLRISDFLIALAALFGLPVVLGVTAGCVVVNALGPIGPVDIVFGSLANLTAASLVMLFRKHRLFACIVGALPVGIIVGGGYLWMFYPPPLEFAFLAATWVAMLISILVSSFVTVTALGYIVLQILSRPNIIRPLEAHGLKVLPHE